MRAKSLASTGRRAGLALVQPDTVSLLMEHTKLVTPSELEDFADRRDSEPAIPELVAQLVNLSVPDLTVCRIPYGDSIGLPGLDGVVQTEGGFRQFVPTQTS